MSNQEKSLLEAMSILLPQAEHRVCMRHLWKAIKKEFPGEFYEQPVWDAARAYTTSQFKMHMHSLKQVSVEAFTYLSNKSFVWARSQFSSISKNHLITNNNSESFNSWILDARFMPVVDLIDKLRVKMMQKFNIRRNQANK